MAALSDHIEALLKQMLDENGGLIIFSRNELAAEMNCVPSQISYVLSTRFKNNQGYLIESRRGGGGSVKIRRILWQSKAQSIMHTINGLADAISQSQADIILQNLYDAEIVNDSQLSLMKAAISNRALAALEANERKYLRSRILANMLCSILTESKTST